MKVKTNIIEIIDAILPRGLSGFGSVSRDRMLLVRRAMVNVGNHPSAPFLLVFKVFRQILPLAPIFIW